MSFTRIKTLLSQQSCRSAIKKTTVEEVRSVNPHEERAYTIKKIKCPKCETKNTVKDYHGTNCFWECDCGQELK